jgi:hypothetical protein
MLDFLGWRHGRVADPGGLELGNELDSSSERLREMVLEISAAVLARRRPSQI